MHETTGTGRQRRRCRFLVSPSGSVEQSCRISRYNEQVHIDCPSVEIVKNVAKNDRESWMLFRKPIIRMDRQTVSLRTHLDSINTNDDRQLNCFNIDNKYYHRWTRHWDVSRAMVLVVAMRTSSYINYYVLCLVCWILLGITGKTDQARVTTSTFHPPLLS